MRQASRVSLRDILYILFRDKWRILGITFTALVGTSIYLAFQDSIYVAESRILIRVGKEKLSGLEPYAKDSYNILFQERGQDIHNGMELLRDESVAHQVLAKLRPHLRQDTTPPDGWFRRAKHEIKKVVATVKAWLSEPLYWFGFRVRLSEEESLLRALRGALAVEAIEDTDILKVRFGWTDPAFAALALNSFTSEFLAQYIRIHKNPTSEAFYEEQIRQKKEALDAAEKALIAFKTSHRIGDLPLQRELLIKDGTALEARLRDVTLKLEEMQSLSAGLLERRKGNGEWIETPDFPQRTTLDLSSLDRQYFELVAQRALLSTTHTAESRELRQIGKRIGALREQKAKSLLTFFRLNARALAAERASLMAKAGELNQRLGDLNRHAPALAELERQREMSERNYLTYRKKAEELRVSDRLNDEMISGVRVFAEARPPVEPSSPRRALILSIALFVGLFFGIGYSAIREYFDNTFRDEDDVRSVLGTDLLLTIPDTGNGVR